VDRRHDTRGRRRHVHRRLVGLERYERILDGDGVADRHENLDYRNLTEVPDVRDGDVDQ
jgi:hypothetical protein